MNIFAFVLAVIAAVIFLFVGDTVSVGNYRRANVSLGLFFLTVALIVQFMADGSRQVTF